MEARKADKGNLVDWFLRAYVGTREIHDVTPRSTPTEGPLATQFLIAVNEKVKAPKLLERDEIGCRLWIVPPEVWEQARDGRAALPGGFGREPVCSWQRTPRHEDVTTRIEALILQNFRRFEDTRMTFGAGINVLIGQNGAGKTTLLDAMAMGLAGAVRPLHPAIGESVSDTAMRLEDIRLAQSDNDGVLTTERQLPARVDVESTPT